MHQFSLVYSNVLGEVEYVGTLHPGTQTSLFTNLYCSPSAVLAQSPSSSTCQIVAALIAMLSYPLRVIDTLKAFIHDFVIKLSATSTNSLIEAFLVCHSSVSSSLHDTDVRPVCLEDFL